MRGLIGPRFEASHCHTDPHPLEPRTGQRPPPAVSSLTQADCQTPGLKDHFPLAAYRRNQDQPCHSSGARGQLKKSPTTIASVGAR